MQPRNESSRSQRSVWVLSLSSLRLHVRNSRALTQFIALCPFANDRSDAQEQKRSGMGFRNWGNGYRGGAIGIADDAATAAGCSKAHQRANRKFDPRREFDRPFDLVSPAGRLKNARPSNITLIEKVDVIRRIENTKSQPAREIGAGYVVLISESEIHDRRLSDHKWNRDRRLGNTVTRINYILQCVAYIVKELRPLRVPTDVKVGLGGRRPDACGLSYEKRCLRLKTQITIAIGIDIYARGEFPEVNIDCPSPRGLSKKTQQREHDGN